MIKEIVLENLFESDTVAYLIEKLMAAEPNVLKSPSMI
jgi:hypothetical protein